MTCTMRHWQQDSSGTSPVETSSSTMSGQSHASSGPELILTQVELISPISKRSESPARVLLASRSHSSRGGEEPKQQAPVHIPLIDIMVVETMDPAWRRKSMDTSQRSNGHKMKLTTQHYGFFEFESLTKNSRDVLFTFLKANIAPERLIVVDHSTDDHSCPSAASTSSAMSLDVERFTAEKMKGASERERWTDKLARKFARLSNTVSEVCSTVCDTACCRTTKDEPCEELTNLPPPPHQNSSGAASSKSIKLSQGNLEVDDTVSVVSSLAMKKKMREKYHIPSGLSIEPDTDSVGSSKQTYGPGTQRRKFRESLKQFNMPSGLSVETEALDDEDDE